LNDLHDRLGLSGPLRLRLSSGPRFITRFHALREQIAQVTLGAGEQESTSEQVSTETDQGQQYEGWYSGKYACIYFYAHFMTAVQTNVSDDEDANHTDDSQEDDSSEDTADDVEDRQSVAADTTEQQNDGASNEAAAQETRDDSEVDAPPDEESNTGEEYTVDKVQTEDVDNLVTNQQPESVAAHPAEELDADEVHRSVDAAEGGDYTEYQEEFSDDDDKFGDALPPEFGGISADEPEHADGHPTGKSEDDEEPEPELVGAEFNEIDGECSFVSPSIVFC
jgi:hypothetical protein